jgi:Recombination endonuclease VII
MARMSFANGTWTRVCVRCTNEFKSPYAEYKKAWDWLCEYFAPIKRGSADGFGPYCRSCARDVNMGRSGTIHREDLLSSQDGKCAICTAEISFGKNATVDHDHKTSITRQVICNRCNNWMAGVDDEEWLAKAIAYRDKHRG